MLERKDFIVPYWNGAPYFDKGPLYHWLSVLAFKIIPDWEIAARLPSAFAGVGCIILVYLLAKTLFNKRVAIVAALILAFTIGFLYRSRTGNLDSLATFFIILSFISFISATKTKKYFLLWGLSLGFLFLTKSGLVVYPLVVFAILAIREKSFKSFKNYFFVLGIILAVIIPTVWLFLGTREAGKPFLDFYLNLLFWPMAKFGKTSETGTRFSLNYLHWLLYGTRLWFFIFLPAFLLTMVKAFKDKIYFFLTAAFLPYLLILMFTKDAGDWYLLPLYPITALMIGTFFSRFQEKFLPRKIGTFLLIVFFLFLAIGKNLYFRHLFIVPETLKNEVELSRKAKEITSTQEILIVDDYYFPVASFYAEREIRVVRREAQDTTLVLSQKSFYQLLKAQGRVILLTTSSNFEKIKKDLPKISFKIAKQQDSHLLVIKP